MILRERTRPKGEQGVGTATGPSWETGSYTITRPYNGYQTTLDFTSSSWQPFSSISVERVGGLIDGEADYGNPWGLPLVYKFDKFPNDTYFDGIDWDIPGVPNDILDLGLAALSNNPNRPDMSVPNSLIELADLPQLVRNCGRTAIRFLKDGAKNFKLSDLGSASLQLQFGILPMISDVQKLLDFQRLVDKRLRMFSDVNRNGGVTTKKRLGQYQQDRGTTTKVAMFSPSFHTIDVQEFASTELWGAVKWVLNKDNSQIPTLDDSDRERLLRATGAAYGAFYSIEDLWNIIPFSWMADYFANIGSVAAAQANQLGLEPTVGAIMKKTTVFRAHGGFTPSPWDSIRCSSGGLTAVSKLRTPFDVRSAQGHLHMKHMKEILSVPHLEILGSLFLTKTRSSKPITPSNNPYINFLKSWL